MNEQNPYVPNVHFELIRICDLVSSQEYQRNLSSRHISKAVEAFDLYQINPVKVSRRQGINYVFDGQHTAEIVAEKSGSRETPVWCMIYDDLTYEHEADIFANQQKYTKTLSPLEIFQANIEAKNTDQLMIRDLVTSYGLTFGNRQTTNTITAVSTLEHIYKKHGFHKLNRTLRLCVGTWQGEKGSFSSNMLNAVAKLVVTYDKELKDDCFEERVGEVSLKQLVRNAKDRRPGAMGYAEALIIAYNGNRKSYRARLDMQKLYSSDIPSLEDTDEEDESSDEETQTEGDEREDDGQTVSLFDDDVDDDLPFANPSSPY